MYSLTKHLKRVVVEFWIGSFFGLCDFKDALQASEPVYYKGELMSRSPPHPKRLSQGLNKTLQADWMELSCGHPPSSDVIGITIFSGKYVNHEPHLGNVTLTSCGFPSKNTESLCGGLGQR